MPGEEMIEITKMNNTQVLINCDLIECIEENPDTTITMVNNKKYVIKESAEEVYIKALEYKRKLLSQGILRL